ncbi:hypothetical protein QBC32DRAFT_266174 [Pseudoneurospora amorphoporcata]|uniref:NmrA-like domain-containing protein n=1 Tax=Pseudoneurospora amorphoporcata TaxID=241081 RepID=A0AAN6NPN5_9PEZI|nr:hypothetical protein QBC32DRAFT_266174 [Pseudoneurospora amorphoporcata]
MSSTINTVAVLGGTGNLGTHIVRALLVGGFTVTILTRSGSTSSKPSFTPYTVTFTEVDYSSPSSLQSAFKGQDAVVSVLATAAVQEQKKIVDAAIAAGVKRFVPSEFGVNTRQKGVEKTKIGELLAGKREVVDYLIQKEGTGLTWTGLSTGFFFESALSNGLTGIDAKNGKATIIDSGTELWPASLQSHIGRAVSEILRHPDLTKNSYLSTASFNVSQNQLLAITEELTGKKLSVTHVDSKDIHKNGEEKLAKGDYSAFVDFLKVHFLADGAGNELKKEESANEKLRLLTEDVRAVVKGWLEEEGLLAA